MKYFCFVIVCLFTIRHAISQNMERPWYVPDHYKLQFAGGIGFLSAGTGYLHGNKKRMETDLYLGYLPKSIGGDHIITVTAKSTYSPLKVKLTELVDLHPLNFGGYLNYSFGSQFDTILPNTYPDGYYWWASSLRLGAFIGGAMTLNMPHGKTNSFSLYYELGSYDLKFISLIQNWEYLRITDVVNLSLGIKVLL